LTTGRVRKDHLPVTVPVAVVLSVAITCGKRESKYGFR